MTMANSTLAAQVISGVAKVEYAFETARVRLYLPNWGETWFFVDGQTTISNFKAQCKSEDNFVKDIRFFTKEINSESLVEVTDE